MPVEPTTGLYIPTPEDLASFKGLSVEDLGASTEQVALFLEISADLLLLRTGLTKAPEPNTPIGRITKYGIMDLAYFLGASSDEWTSMFSPFSSERLGSYAYSKASSAAAAKRDLLDAPLFDEAVKWLTELSDDKQGSGVSYTSEHVFPNTLEDHIFKNKYPSVRRRGVPYNDFL